MNFENEMQKLRDADPSANLQMTAFMPPYFVAPARKTPRRLLIGAFAIAVLAVPGYFSIFQNSRGGDNAAESALDVPIELPTRGTAISPTTTTVAPTTTTVAPTTTTTTTTTLAPYQLPENENTVWFTGAEGDSMEEVAPEGKVYTEVLFASYGNPTVTDGKFEQGSCHAENSMEIVAEAFIGKSSGELTFDTSTFGDPCVGTRKTFAVVLEIGDDPSPTTTTTVLETTTTSAAPETTTTLPENVVISLTGSRFYGEPDSAVVWELSCEGSTELCDWAKVRCEGNTLDMSVTGTNVRKASYTGSVSLGEGGVPKPSNVNFSGTASLTILPRPVTLTPTDLSKTYGDPDPTLTFSTLGLNSGDSLSGSLTRAVGENVGTHAISQGTLTTENNPNYMITFVGEDFTINKKPVTVTPDANQSKTYGAADPTFTYSVSPALVGTDSLTGALGRVSGSDVGTYELDLGDLANSNYTITFSGTPVDFTINELAVTVTPDSGQSKTYGAADPTFTYSVSPALVGTDSLTGALGRVSGSDVGTYELDLGDLANSNYTVTFSDTPVNFTINKKPVTVTPVSGQSKTYGAVDPTLAFSTLGLKSGDSLSGDLTYTGTDVGSYAITQGTVTTANNSNYTVTLSDTPVDFTITAQSLTVTVSGNDKIQEGATAQAIATPSQPTTGQVSWSASPSSVCTVSATGLVTGVTAGNCVVVATFAAAGNYQQGSGDATVQIAANVAPTTTTTVAPTTTTTVAPTTTTVAPTTTTTVAPTTTTPKEKGKGK